MDLLVIMLIGKMSEPNIYIHVYIYRERDSLLELLDQKLDAW